MENSKLAKQLYIDCGNTNPHQHTLMPWNYEPIKDKDIFYSMILGTMINRYAVDEFEGDWIPFDRDQFRIAWDDNEGWKNVKKTAYRLEKKGFVESKFDSGKNFIRLTDRGIYDAAIYQRDFSDQLN